VRKIKALLSTAVLAGGFGLATATPASATVDTTPPTITLGDIHYRTGASLVDYYTDSSGDPCSIPSSTCTPFIDTMPVYRTWKTGDASGICSEAMGVTSYEAYTGNGDAPFNFVTGTASPDGFDPNFQPDSFGNDDAERSLMPDQTRRWNYTYSYDDRVYEARQLRVIDCANNMTVSPVFTPPSMGGLTEDSADTSQVTYAGAWNTTKCLCFSGGTTHSTSAAGASVACLKFIYA